MNFRTTISIAVNVVNEYRLTGGRRVLITRLNDLNEFKVVRFNGNREMNQISESSNSPTLTLLAAKTTIRRFKSLRTQNSFGSSLSG